MDSQHSSKFHFQDDAGQSLLEYRRKMDLPVETEHRDLAADFSGRPLSVIELQDDLGRKQYLDRHRAFMLERKRAEESWLVEQARMNVKSTLPASMQGSQTTNCKGNVPFPQPWVSSGIPNANTQVVSKPAIEHVWPKAGTQPSVPATLPSQSAQKPSSRPSRSPSFDRFVSEGEQRRARLEQHYLVDNKKEVEKDIYKKDVKDLHSEKRDSRWLYAKPFMTGNRLAQLEVETSRVDEELARQHWPHQPLTEQQNLVDTSLQDPFIAEPRKAGSSQKPPHSRMAYDADWKANRIEPQKTRQQPAWTEKIVEKDFHNCGLQEWIPWPWTPIPKTQPNIKTGRTREGPIEAVSGRNEDESKTQATVRRPSRTQPSFMEESGKAEYRYWTVRHPSNISLSHGEDLHARFLHLGYDGSVRLMTSPNKEISIPMADLAPWDVLYVEGITSYRLDGFCDSKPEAVTAPAALKQHATSSNSPVNASASTEFPRFRCAELVGQTNLEKMNAMVEETKEKATNDKAAAPAGSGTGVSCPTFAEMQRRTDSEAAKKENLEASRCRLMKTLQGSCHQIYHVSDKDDYLPRKAKMECARLNMVANVEGQLARVYEDSGKSPSKKVIDHEIRGKVSALEEEELAAMFAVPGSATKQLATQNAGQDIEVNVDAMDGVTFPNSKANEWTEIEKEADVELEEDWQDARSEFAAEDADHTFERDMEEEELGEMVEDDDWQSLTPAEINGMIVDYTLYV